MNYQRLITPRLKSWAVSQLHPCSLDMFPQLIILNGAETYDIAMDGEIEIFNLRLDTQQLRKGHSLIDKTNIQIRSFPLIAQRT
jgi:hypothetical protein